jgi:transcriptional regulator with XRE-family HTH domain
MLSLAVKYAVPAAVYPDCMDTMGDRIRALRRARGLTQAELAKLCGVTKSAVSQWEAGSTANIKLQALLALLAALHTDVPYLLYGPDRAAPAPDRKRTSGKGSA